MNDEKIFAEGFFFKRNPKAPDWAVGKLSMNIDKARAFVQKHAKDGWLNMEVKQAKNGNYYVELDTWEPDPKAVHDQGMAQAKDALDDEDLPFDWEVA